MSILLVMTMIVSLFTIIPFEVGAANGVQYIERSWDDANKVVVDTEKTCTSYTLLASRSSDTLYSGWYVVDRDMTINGRLRVSGTVNLILCDNNTLTLKSGATVLENDSLNIYAQSDGDNKGKIYSHPSDSTDDFEMKDSAVIGGTVDDPNAGNIVVHGGNLDLKAPSHQGFFTYNDAACLGGGYKGTVKSVKVFGGNVKCESPGGGAAIGGGEYGAPSNGDGLLIYGGIIEATSHCANGDGAAAIGGGYDSPHASGTIRIYGGEIQAKAINGGAAIGSGEETDSNNIVITGGNITATATTGNGESGAGIGSGCGGRAHEISISNAVITAVASSGAGIGSGEKGHCDGVNIISAYVAATSLNGGAAIGSGYKGDCDDIFIDDGSYILAYSKEFKETEEVSNDLAIMGAANIPQINYKVALFKSALSGLGALISLCTPDKSGAAIGSGIGGNVNSIKISNKSYVRASSGNYSACIGSGEDGDFGTIEIDNCTYIKAKSGSYGAAIGSGDEAKHCGTITINNTEVNAEAGTDAAAIGTGNEADQSATINITGSDIIAKGGRYAAGIGGGDAVSGGTINITNSTITEAKSETDGAGIGGGESGNGGTINITGSTVTAHGGGYAAGIGGGDSGDGGTITIDHSTVKAYGGTDAAGIGGGEDGDGGYITIKNHSDVYAEGKEYGAGIGGGEDAGVQKVHIDYTSKAVACAGGDGNSVAIGPGDYNKTAAWLSGNYPSKGTLTLSPQYHIVEAGSSPGSTSTYTKNDIWNACRNNKYAYIHPCEHGSTYYKACSEYSHYKCCSYCGEQIEEAEYHSFGSDNKCTKCGATTEIISCTFIEKNNSGEVTRTDSMQKYTDWLVPYAENVPDGSIFHYWEYTAGSGSTYKLYPGTITTLNEARAFRAVYAPGVETYYIDENGELQNVTAMRLTKSNLNLDVEWYIIDSESNLSSSDEIQLNRSVNIIIADDADVTIADITNRHNSVSIFGQGKQSGKFTAIGQSYVYDYKQYGANINLKGIKTFNNFVFASGTFVTDLPTTCNNTMELSWYRYDKDSIWIDTIFDCDTFKIADGKAFQNDRGKILQGTLTWSQLRDDVERKTLTPYTERKYGTPTWTWSKDYSLAVATFKSTDAGVDETITVQGDITIGESGRDRTYVASCTLNGKKYTSETIRIEVFYHVTGQGSSGGRVDVDIRKAEPGTKITIIPHPYSGSILKSITAVRSDGEEKVRIEDDNTFIMPDSDVTVTGEFISPTPATEPYTDGDGEYHLGNIKHFEIDGKYYAVNEDGSVGDELDSVELSYFDFALLEDDTYQIRCYTGPMDNLSQLEIPKTFNGKAITVLGDEEQSFMKGTGTQRAFSLVLNENVTTIKGLAFFWSMLTEVKGDTSGLNQIKDTPFVWANISDENKLTLKLDYPGRITVDSNALNYENITACIKHATTLSSDGKASSIEYIFTDAHTYGEPSWTWADDYSSATATFTCADSRCKHEETVSATVTSAESEDNTIYIATAEFDGETYTDVKGSYYIRITGSEHGTVTADKTYADEGETVTLTATPDDKYMLKSVTVKDADNNAVTVTNNSFIMPAGGVTVSAVFGIRTANISVGGVGINANNCSDILGDGTASYDFVRHQHPYADEREYRGQKRQRNPL